MAAMTITSSPRVLTPSSRSDVQQNVWPAGHEWPGDMAYPLIDKVLGGHAADRISFEMQRPFTNYSGDISGRFLEIASLTSLPGKMTPDTLPLLLQDIARFQKADGHFGRDVDWSMPLEPENSSAVILPVFWGHSRLLVGLLEAYRATGQAELLGFAKRIGDFYHYEMNRTANGGFGHHNFVCDEAGPLLMQPTFTEAVWCCTFHGLLGLHTLKSYVVAGSQRGVFISSLRVPVSITVGVQNALRILSENWL